MIRDGIGSEPIGDITLFRVIIVIGSQVKFKTTSSGGRWSTHTLIKITLNNNTFVDMYPHVNYFDCVLPLLYIFSSFKINFEFFFFDQFASRTHP